MIKIKLHKVRTIGNTLDHESCSCMIVECESYEIINKNPSELYKALDKAMNKEIGFIKHFDKKEEGK